MQLIATKFDSSDSDLLNSESTTSEDSEASFDWPGFGLKNRETTSFGNPDDSTIAFSTIANTSYSSDVQTSPEKAQNHDAPCLIDNDSDGGLFSQEKLRASKPKLKIKKMRTCALCRKNLIVKYFILGQDQDTTLYR
jgi:hypothetical protein